MTMGAADSDPDQARARSVRGSKTQQTPNSIRLKRRKRSEGLCCSPNSRSSSGSWPMRTTTHIRNRAMPPAATASSCSDARASSCNDARAMPLSPLLPRLSSTASRATDSNSSSGGGCAWRARVGLSSCSSSELLLPALAYLVFDLRDGGGCNSSSRSCRRMPCLEKGRHGSTALRDGRSSQSSSLRGVWLVRSSIGALQLQPRFS